MKTNCTTHLLLGVIATGVGCLTLLALTERFQPVAGEPDDEAGGNAPYGGPDDPLDATGDVPYPLPVTVI